MARFLLVLNLFMVGGSIATPGPLWARVLWLVLSTVNVLGLLHVIYGERNN